MSHQITVARNSDAWQAECTCLWSDRYVSARLAWAYGHDHVAMASKMAVREWDGNYCYADADDIEYYTRHLIVSPSCVSDIIHRLYSGQLSCGMCGKSL
jgi:hypothetical protein